MSHLTNKEHIMTVHLHADARRASGTSLQRQFALVVACLVAVAAMISGATTAFAADFTIEQGESIRFYSGDATNVTLEPPGAGTITVIPALPGVPLSAVIEFTASASFDGVATVRYDSVQLGSGVTTTIQVQGPQARASGYFVPVAAPGPCLLITANPIVLFGDVELGGPFKDTPAPPNVGGCAPNSVRQDVLVQTSNATNGPATLTPTCSGLAPAACTTTDGSYAVAILDDALIVGPTPTAWLDGFTGNFGVRAPQLAVKMPPTLAPTFVGSLFTFDVTFTAVVD